MKTGKFDDMLLTTHNFWETEGSQLFREQIMQAIYKKEEKAMKFKECLKCAHIDNPWRCACCYNADKFSPIEKTITTEKEYHKMFKHPIYPKYSIPHIKDVIFNDPATIVFWEDGTKTVVKVMEGDEFDPHTGLAQAISKKALGDDYRKEFKKWTKPYYKKKDKEKIADLEVKTGVLKMQTAFDEAVSTVMKNLHKDDAE